MSHEPRVAMRLRLQQQQTPPAQYCPVGQPLIERWHALVKRPRLNVPTEQQPTYRQMQKIMDHAKHCDPCGESFRYELSRMKERSHTAKLAAPVDIMDRRLGDDAPSG